MNSEMLNPQPIVLPEAHSESASEYGHVSNRFGNLEPFMHQKPQTPESLVAGLTDARAGKHCIPRVFGYGMALNTDNTCGPASMGTVMDYYRLGWNDIPVWNDGHFDNEPYIRRIMQWSGAPDILGGKFGTSPMRIVDTMHKLPGMKAVWYSGSTFENSMNWLINEINNNRPVFVLMDLGGFHFDWQIAFAYEPNRIVTKVPPDGRNISHVWSYEEFDRQFQNNIPGWNRSFITVVKQ